MLARSCARCAARARPTTSTHNSFAFARPSSFPRTATPRRFGSHAGGAGAGGSSDAAIPHGTPASAVGLLSPLTSELDRIAPSFDLCGDQIEVIQTPAQFYSTLKDRIRSARRRIFLSTLYIGKSERELLETVQQAMRDSPELKLSILTDALRGTREAPRPSCASLLAPLVEEFGAGRVEVRMYHTPNLTGLRKRTVPKRINEGWGLQHMKLYGIDDEIILSGYVTLETVEEMGIGLANRI
jgi:CDP-diacylglycerol---glycerol-3-phosphate 3-phosphatidyltransferase